MGNPVKITQDWLKEVRKRMAKESLRGGRLIWVLKVKTVEDSEHRQGLGRQTPSSVMPLGEVVIAGILRISDLPGRRGQKGAAVRSRAVGDPCVAVGGGVGLVREPGHDVGQLPFERSSIERLMPFGWPPRRSIVPSLPWGHFIGG